MFTGLIEERGVVESVDPRGEFLYLAIRTVLDAGAIGASVAVDGVCLTATRIDSNILEFDLGPETLRKTSLGALRPGDEVNLERPLALGDRLGGHLVQGHVDGVGEIVRREVVGEGALVELRLPPGLASLVVSKGSIALDGISLTVNALLDPDRISLFIIPG